MKVEVLNNVESGNTVVTEMKMSGVNTGDMEMMDPKFQLPVNLLRCAAAR